MYIYHNLDISKDSVSALPGCTFICLFYSYLFHNVGPEPRIHPRHREQYIMGESPTTQYGPCATLPLIQANEPSLWMLPNPDQSWLYNKLLFLESRHGTGMTAMLYGKDQNSPMYVALRGANLHGFPGYAYIMNCETGMRRIICEFTPDAPLHPGAAVARVEAASAYDSILNQLVFTKSMWTQSSIQLDGTPITPSDVTLKYTSEEGDRASKYLRMITEVAEMGPANTVAAGRYRPVTLPTYELLLVQGDGPGEWWVPDKEQEKLYFDFIAAEGHGDCTNIGTARHSIRRSASIWRNNGMVYLTANKSMVQRMMVSVMYCRSDADVGRLVTPPIHSGSTYGGNNIHGSLVFQKVQASGKSTTYYTHAARSLSVREYQERFQPHKEADEAKDDIDGVPQDPMAPSDGGTFRLLI
jgi:hypothetical protein